MSRPINYLITLIVLLSITQLSCSLGSGYPAEVKAVLEKAGDNKGELEKVLEHYKEQEDSVKYEAACFLIANMDGHCYAKFKLVDSTATKIEFNVLDYPDFDSLLKAAEYIEELYGELDFERDTLIYDLDAIKADFLIEHIDIAFEAWRERSWAKSLPFDIFSQYVLPYRGSNEPLESWRKYFYDMYRGIDTLLENSDDPMLAARFINNDIRSWFKFDERYYYHPTDLGFDEMLKTKMGRCEDMTNLAIFTLRANGIAVTSDYTPHWANTGNNHAWNAIVMPDGEVVPFMGCESNPGDYGLANKLAKVYRKSFGKQKDNLIFQERKQEKVPGWLAGKSYIDVTSSYIEVINYKFDIKREIPDSIDIAYICVFNSGKWRAIDWAKIEGDSAFFTDLGPDIIYLPVLYVNEEIEPFGLPFVPHFEENTIYFKADTTELLELTLKHTTTRALVVSTDGVAPTEFIIGDDYELFYWDDEWISAGMQTAEVQSLTFDNVPAQGLYWLTKVDGREDERIFSLDKGKIVWW